MYTNNKIYALSLKRNPCHYVYPSSSVARCISPCSPGGRDSVELQEGEYVEVLQQPASRSAQGARSQVRKVSGDRGYCPSRKLVRVASSAA